MSLEFEKKSQGGGGGGSGDVVGPASATDNAVARFNAATGKLIQDTSNVTIDDSGNMVIAGTVDGRDVATDGAKLDGIEAGATADQTDAEIKTAYENNADTNAFTDADHTKLDGIDAGAKVGDVVGPASAVDDRIAAFDSTTGKLIKDGGKLAARVVFGPASSVGIGDFIAVFNGNVNDEIKSSGVIVTAFALANGTRPAWSAQDTAPTSPSDGHAWYRTLSPQKLFVYNSTDSRWYASETFTWDANRNGTMSGDTWLGRHRQNSLSSNDRGSRYSMKIHWYSMQIHATNQPGPGKGIDLSINGSFVHQIDWSLASNGSQESVNLTSGANEPIRAQYQYTSGTHADNPQVYLEGREYV